MHPIDNHGSIQLRFTVAGKRYSFHPVPSGTYGNPVDMLKAQAIATQIRLDIFNGTFDPTLTRYRPATPETQTTPKPPADLLELWDDWVKTLGLSDATKADHYEMVRRMIVKARPKPHETAWFTRSTLAPATYNKRLSYLKRCMTWHGLANTWATIKPRKPQTQPVKPFNASEIAQIIEGFRTIEPHYVPLVSFLFITGCRLSEAIGLTWQHIDLASGTIEISESLSVDRTGNGYARTRKRTKTGSTRVLTVNPELRELLLGQSQTDDLVFLSPQGFPIASGNLRRAWVKVLKSQGVPYRKLHAIRHTVLSMAVAQGIPVTSVAYIAGHKDSRMVLQTYGHIIDRPSLPDVL
jgi:integrase